MSDIRFCSCSVGFCVDFEKNPVSVHVALLHSTVSLKAKDASSDFRRSHDAPLPQVKRGTIKDRGPVFRLSFANR